MQDLSIKYRHASTAMWINCLAPGLGLYYLGQQRQAWCFLLMTSLPWFILLLMPWRDDPALFLAAALVSLFILVISMLIARQQASQLNPVIISTAQRWYGYGLFWLSFVLLCVLWLALMVWRSGWLPYQVATDTMQPTIAQDDWIIIDTRRDRLGVLQRDDIVLFRHPETGKEVLQRVVGLPAERVTVHGGGLFIDGRWQPEPYVSDALNQQRIPEGVVEMTVPTGAYFVLADNRDNSRDSRYWGALAAKQIQGVLIYQLNLREVSPEELLNQITGLSFSE